MKISELRPRQAVEDIVFKVLELGEERVTSSGNKVVEAVVGDETGIVKLTLWNEAISKVDVGKTYELKNGYVTLFRGNMRLTVGRNGELVESEKEIQDINTSNDVSEKKYEDYGRLGRFNRRYTRSFRR